jgi:hypothetical protein
MILALKEPFIRGDIHTTVECIVTIMESDDSSTAASTRPSWTSASSTARRCGCKASPIR